MRPPEFPRAASPPSASPRPSRSEVLPPSAAGSRETTSVWNRPRFGVVDAPDRSVARFNLTRTCVLPRAAPHASARIEAAPPQSPHTGIRSATLSRYSCNPMPLRRVRRNRLLVTMPRKSARRPVPSDDAGTPVLLQFVLLSMLLHILVVMIFGSATLSMSGARRGDGWLGPLDVTLRQVSPELGAGFTLAPGADTKLP